MKRRRKLNPAQRQNIQRMAQEAEYLQSIDHYNVNAFLAAHPAPAELQRRIAQTSENLAVIFGSRMAGATGIFKENLVVELMTRQIRMCICPADIPDPGVWKEGLKTVCTAFVPERNVMTERERARVVQSLSGKELKLFLHAVEAMR